MSHSQHLSPPRVRRLFTGEDLQVYDWRCSGAECGGEEWSDQAEIVVIRRGVFRRQVGRVSMLACPGTVMLYRAQEAYRVRHPVPGGDECTIFRLSARAIDELVREISPWRTAASGGLFAGGIHGLGGSSYLRHRLLLEAFRGASSDRLEIEERAVEFLRQMGSEAAQAEPVSSPGQRAAGRAYADRVQQVIAARFRERLTLADFARAAGCSVFHLSRTVRAHAGSPIHRLLMRARLREALELILDRPGDLTRLALSLGFASHSHLSDAFKREYGVAPGQLKRISRTMLAAARRRAESP